MRIKKVMLAVKADLGKIKFPTDASPKLDGIRCVTPDRNVVTRTLKPIPNTYIRESLAGSACAANLDGELVTLDEQGEVEPFNTIQSKVMSVGGSPRFELLVFDSIYNHNLSFAMRYDQARRQVELAKTRDHHLQIVPQIRLTCMDELVEFEATCVARGYEGVMIRDPGAPYKFGRSTVNQGWLLKIKRFEDDEGVVVGMKQEVNKHGQHKDSLGALILETKAFGAVEVGTGFTQKQRAFLWRDYQHGFTSLGKLVTYRYQPFGMKASGKPRFPAFKGFRDPLDM